MTYTDTVVRQNLFSHPFWGAGDAPAISASIPNWTAYANNGWTGTLGPGDEYKGRTSVKLTAKDWVQGPLVDTNLVSNPNGATNDYWLIGGGATGTYGLGYIEAAYTAANSSNTGLLYNVGATKDPGLTFAVGDLISASAEVWVNVDKTLTLYRQCIAADGTDLLTANTNLDIPANTWTPITVDADTNSVPVGTSYIRVLVYSQSGWNAGETVRARSLTVNEGATAATPFSGDTAWGDGFIYNWSGAAELSSSLRYQGVASPNVKLAFRNNQSNAPVSIPAGTDFWFVADAYLSEGALSGADGSSNTLSAVFRDDPNNDSAAATVNSPYCKTDLDARDTWTRVWWRATVDAGRTITGIYLIGAQSADSQPDGASFQTVNWFATPVVDGETEPPDIFDGDTLGYSDSTGATVYYDWLGADDLSVSQQVLRSTDAIWQSYDATSLTSLDIDGLDTEGQYEIQVRAASDDGVYSDWTPSVYYTTPIDSDPPSIPSTPIVTSKLGGFTVQWDGKTQLGGTMEPDFAEVHVLANGTLIGTIGSPNGSTITWTDCQYDTDYTFTLVAVDTSGNASDASTAVIMKVTPLVDADLIGQVVDGANVKDGSITTTQIGDDQVTAGKIAVGAVTVEKVDFDASDIGGALESDLATAQGAIDTLNTDTIPGLQSSLDANDSAIATLNNTTIPAVQDAVTAASTAASAAQTTADGKNRVFTQDEAPVSDADYTLQTNDIWFDSDDHEHMYRWDGGSWVDAMQATMSYVQSRGSDSVTNGYASLSNNTNFSAFTYSSADAPTGVSGMFVSPAGGYRVCEMDEYIPIDPAKKLKFSFYVKQTAKDANGNLITDGRFYGLAHLFDSYQLGISPRHHTFYPGTTTTLAVDLNPGDATITLTDSANWYGSASLPAGSISAARSIIWWDYVDQGGKLWPPESYSRNVSDVDYWADGGVVGNVITLRAPYDGPARPAGTPLSDSANVGGTYMYSTTNEVVPTEWTQFSNAVSGVVTDGSAVSFAAGWPPGTGYIKLGWLCNYTSGNQASQMAVAGVSFSDATAAQDMAEAAQLSANGKNHIYRQSTAPTGGGANPPLAAGDVWFDSSNGNLAHVFDGTQWAASQFQGLAVGNLDAGSITTGALDADRIAAGTITGDMIASRTVVAENISAGTVTSNEIASKTIIADNIEAGTITTAEIAAHTINATNIEATSITASELAADAVTADKIKAGSVDASKIAADTITANQIATGAISADELSAGAVTTAKLDAEAVTADKIQANAITAAQIAAGTITGTEIDAQTITANNLAGDSVTATQLAADSVTATAIKAGSVITEAIAANAITVDKMDANSVDTGQLVADAVTTAKIAALAVTADQISANAITADKIDAGAIDGMTISGLTMQAVNQLAIGARTSDTDGVQGWFFDSDGYATANDSSGATFLTVDPRSGEQYFQVGGTSNYLKYDIVDSTMVMNGTFLSAEDNHPRVRIENDLWGGSFVGVHFETIGNQTSGVAGVKTNLVTFDNHDPGSLFLTSANIPGAPDPSGVGEIQIGNKEIDIQVRGVSGSSGSSGLVLTTSWVALSLNPGNASGDLSTGVFQFTSDIGGTSNQGTAWDMYTEGAGGNYTRRFFTDDDGIRLEAFTSGTLKGELDVYDSGQIYMHGTKFTMDGLPAKPSSGTFYYVVMDLNYNLYYSTNAL